MKRSLASAAIAAAALLTLPVTAHAAENDFHTVPLPFLWPRAALEDVAPDGTGGVWVAGGQGSYCALVLWGGCVIYYPGNPVVRHWTGSSWAEYPIDGWTGSGIISRVTSGAGQTWIGGAEYGHHEQIFAFDGTSFQKVAAPSPDSRVTMLRTGPGGTWVTQDVSPSSDEPHLFRRDGSSWTGVDLPGRKAKINDIQSLSASEVWAVGNRPYPDGAGRRPAVARFDGTAWTWLPDLDPVHRTLTQVLPFAPNDIWVGSSQHLAHWDGSAWTTIEGPGDSVSEFTVDGSGTLWSSDRSTLYRRTGGSWQPVTLTGVRALKDITAVGTSTVWAVGEKVDDAPAPIVVTNS